MSDASNIDEIGAFLDMAVETFDFTRTGKEKSLGRDLAGVVALGIQERSIPDHLDPTGNPWAANEEKYARWKREKYEVDQPGQLTGQMLGLESLIGETRISSDSVEMIYGVDKPAEKTLNGAELPKAKEPPTDRQKAEWFTEGGREFFGLDETIAEACVKEVDQSLDAHIEELLGGS